MIKRTLFTILLMFILISVNTTSLNIVNANDQVETTSLVEFNNVVIFIKFKDEVAYQAPHPLSYYQDMFNGENNPSLKDYFEEVSYNQLSITSLFPSNTEFIYYVDTQNRSYYEPYDAFSNTGGYQSESQSEVREHTLLKNAVDFIEDNNLIDDNVDLDYDNDGEIDSISFLVSKEDTGWNTLLWPHKWELYTYYDYSSDQFVSGAPMINGKYAYTYTFELLGDDVFYDNKVDVATLAHETFHLLGAPDLYHYNDYTWIQPVGYWGLMESLNKDPNHMLGYMKEAYGGWITNPTEITTSGSYTLNPLENATNNLYKINLNKSNEYLYIEYRQNTGVYESNLSDSGLLVYRVDKDFADVGNVNGYYNESQIAQEEVFIFRPNMYDQTYPITFPVADNSFIDEDGDIDLAILSSTNPYKEIGKNTSIPMFFSDGTEINITITNIIESNGTITFDVVFPASLNLVSDAVTTLDNLVLVDIPGSYYSVEINNTTDDYQYYYTTDGSTPTTNSSLYNGNPIEINSTNHLVKVAVYNGSNYIYQFSEDYSFSSTVESNHNPYGNLKTYNWLINLDESKNISLTFNNLFELEDEYDYLTIKTSTTLEKYTGTSLRDTVLTYLDNYVLINLKTDDYVDEYYGFKLTPIITSTVDFTLINGNYLEVPQFSTYEDPGYTMTGDNASEYHVVVTNNFNPETFLNIIGEYTTTYYILDSLDNVITSYTRTINVYDNIAPSVTLNPSVDTIFENDSYINNGVTATDNHDTNLTILTTNNVDSSEVGVYEIIYTVNDDRGNTTIIKRIVHVIKNQETFDFECPLFKTSYEINDNYQIPVCIVNAKAAIADTSNINNSVEGIYEVVYSIVIDEVTYNHKIYLYFYDKTNIEVPAVLLRKRELI
ncbi:hypothetical protein CI105_08820 [Candidatus Izimaplasma bacterium ZiA1]|uniref:M6 family metalloprotease domain-containing protein n=1 Tax=Candidatus Izimoplasma sp. ZiA1 TaxID=2024899 RepID=UPI000BAA74F8|nr:hypothetical protein CI105_08820 [Candidatus Izimaplasma bacterium ZiA1]